LAVASTGLDRLSSCPWTSSCSGSTELVKALNPAGRTRTPPRRSAPPTRFAKQAVAVSDSGFTVGAMIKGRGHGSRPGLATMLCVLTTERGRPMAATLDAALREASRQTLDRVDTDGCMSTNDTVLLLRQRGQRRAGFSRRPARSGPERAGRPLPAAHLRRGRRLQARHHRGGQCGHRGTRRVEVGPQRRPFRSPQVRPCTATIPTGDGCSPPPVPPRPAFEPADARPSRSTA